MCTYKTKGHKELEELKNIDNHIYWKFYNKTT